MGCQGRGGGCQGVEATRYRQFGSVGLFLSLVWCHATHLELGDLVPQLLHLRPDGAHEVRLDQVLGEKGEQTDGLKEKFQV